MKISFKRIDHIQICVPRTKEAEARAFYIGVLGLKEIEKPAYLVENGGFWLEIADIQLHIGVEDQVHESKRHPAFEIDDLEAAKAFLSGLNIRIKEDEPIPNFRRFSFFDPFNNRIELLERTDAYF